MHISRRSLLGTLAVGTVALAGCSGSESSEGADCTTAVAARSDAGVVQQAVVRPNDGSAVLQITFSGETAADSGASYVDVYDAGDQLQHRIPVDDQRDYSVTVGSIPFHGVYRVTATDSEGTELDVMTIEFNCFESAQ